MKRLSLFLKLKNGLDAASIAILFAGLSVANGFATASQQSSPP